MKKSNEILAQKIMENVKKNVGSGCIDKFEEIMKYLKENVGEL